MSEMFTVVKPFFGINSLDSDVAKALASPDGKSFGRAFLNKSKNYDPTGVAQPLRTSESQGESKKSLTTWNVSDILQNNLTVKPEGLAYTAFNEQLSDVSKTVESFKVNGKSVNFPGKSYLLSSQQYFFYVCFLYPQAIQSCLLMKAKSR